MPWISKSSTERVDMIEQDEVCHFVHDLQAVDQRIFKRLVDHQVGQTCHADNENERNLH